MASAINLLAERYFVCTGTFSFVLTESVTMISFIGAVFKISDAPPANKPWLATAYMSVAPPRSTILAASAKVLPVFKISSMRIAFLPETSPII